MIDVLGSNEEDISVKVENESEQKDLLELVKKLNKREKVVLQSRYGLMDSPKRTQREIAKDLAISRSYVSRIEKKAIEKLVGEIGKMAEVGERGKIGKTVKINFNK